MGATIGTKLHTLLRGKLVGEDEFGNRYYTERKVSCCGGRGKRWVIYLGVPEASKVPAHWHGWLHYTHDQMPTADAAKRYPWQKEHKPNLTGTKLRYLPPGHVLGEGDRPVNASDYQPWQP